MSPKSPEAVAIRTDDEKLVNPPGEPERGEERLEPIGRLTKEQLISLYEARASTYEYWANKGQSCSVCFLHGAVSVDIGHEEAPPYKPIDHSMIYDIIFTSGGEWQVFCCPWNGDQFVSAPSSARNMGDGRYELVIDRGEAVDAHYESLSERGKNVGSRDFPYRGDIVVVEPPTSGRWGKGWSFASKYGIDRPMRTIGQPVEIEPSSERWSSQEMMKAIGDSGLGCALLNEPESDFVIAA